MRAIAAALLALVLTAACTVPADEPTAVQPAESGQPSEAATPKALPVKLTAVKAKAKASVIGGTNPLSCAKVTVTNGTGEVLLVNPYYFALTDTTGIKHTTDDVIGEYEDQIPDTKLSPGEKAEGMVCAKGRWTPKQVAMTNEILDIIARAAVG
jgi:hypothetical protein